jgi:hypothetical protein
VFVFVRPPPRPLRDRDREGEREGGEEGMDREGRERGREGRREEKTVHVPRTHMPLTLLGPRDVGSCFYSPLGWMPTLEEALWHEHTPPRPETRSTTQGGTDPRAPSRRGGRSLGRRTQGSRVAHSAHNPGISVICLLLIHTFW